MPQRWLFTDERLGGHKTDDPLWQALGNLPPGGGIVFRHYGWPLHARLALCAQLRDAAHQRQQLLLVSRLAFAADGVHRPAGLRTAGHGGLITASAHDRAQILQAFADGADAVFLSPVFATRSHPGAPTLGPERFSRLARAAPGPVLALGGMNEQRWQQLQPLGAAGYGGIDCWQGQKPLPAAGGLAPQRPGP